MILPDAYVIILMMSTVSGPSKMADIFASDMLIQYGLIWLAQVNLVVPLAKPKLLGYNNKNG